MYRPIRAHFFYGPSRYPVDPANLNRFLPVLEMGEPADSLRPAIERAMTKLCGGCRLTVDSIEETERGFYFSGNGFDVVYERSAQ